jgi:rsbT co-antagonist protein RsbR
VGERTQAAAHLESGAVLRATPTYLPCGRTELCYTGNGARHMTAGGDTPSIELDGITYAWDRARGLMLMNGMPVAAFLLESTLAGMMWGFERMVGTERFDLAMRAAGRLSVEDEWRTFISQLPAPEEGIRILGSVTPLGGLGRWEVVRFDQATKTACFRVTAGFEPIYQASLKVTWGSSFLAGKFAGYCTRAFGVGCWAEQTRFVVRGDEYDEFIVAPSDETIEERLDKLLLSGEMNAADLAAAIARLQREIAERRQAEERMAREVAERREAEAQLRHEVEERRRIEDELRAKLDLIEQQAAEIQAMSAPILQLSPGVLAVPIVGRLDRDRSGRVTESLLSAIVARRARAVILDLTGAEGIDTAALDNLLQLVRAIRLLGARCLISGMSPQAAQIVVDLGADLRALETHANVEDALQAALRRKK